MPDAPITMATVEGVKYLCKGLAIYISFIYALLSCIYHFDVRLASMHISLPYTFRSHVHLAPFRILLLRLRLMGPQRGGPQATLPSDY
jgi:hypothetical protein